jgi:molybdopterin converting factor small subunit
LSVTVNLYAAARHAAKQNSLTIDARSLAELKIELIQQIPGLASVIPQCSFVVDGHSFGRTGDCDIHTAQQIDVMPPFSGG